MDQQQLGKLMRIGGAAATVGVVASVHAAAEHMPLGQVMAVRAMLSGVLILIYGLMFTAIRADREGLASFAATMLVKQSHFRNTKPCHAKKTHFISTWLHPGRVEKNAHVDRGSRV